MEKRDFVPLKRVSTTISNKISGDGLDIDGQYQGALLNNQMVSKATFDILGLMTDHRFLNLQCEDPGAGTIYDVSGQGHDGTYQGSMTTGDRIKKGMGWAIDFDGTDDYINLGNGGDFTFGDGTNDEAVTWFGVNEVVNGTGTQIIISKYDLLSGNELREWYIYLTGGELLNVVIYDESANVQCSRYTDSSVSVGFHTYAITYDGAGGATAANTIKIYVDGAHVASTAVNDASYVAMEDLTVPCWIGARRGSGGASEAFMIGDTAMNGIDGSEWSAMDVHRFHQICKGLYGL